MDTRAACIGYGDTMSMVWALPKNSTHYTMKLGDTTQRLDAPSVISWLESLDIPDDQISDLLPDLPKTAEIDGKNRISSDEIAAYLFDKGIASDSIRNLLDHNGEFIRIANWYNRWGTSPSEHETVSHLVVPLLRILGWTPQRIALEWRMNIFPWSSKLRRFATRFCGQYHRLKTTHRHFRIAAVWS